MDGTARDDFSAQFLQDFSDYFEEPESSDCDIFEFKPGRHQSESLYENFVNEIDAWARHALASNGFGDY